MTISALQVDETVKAGRITVRLAQDENEILQAQKLRYKVFYDERKAIPSKQMAAERRDFDKFDTYADHLVVVNEDATSDNAIVGTYRLLRREVAEKHGRFYTSDEYDISGILKSDMKLLELGRSCVLAPYRTRPVLQLLWQGITDYMLDHEIGLMFGCASFLGTDIDEIKESLAYLYHFHQANPSICPRALPERYVDMNLAPKDSLNERRSFAALPPLIKGYLRLGARIGDGAVIDHQFNTIDVCIVLDMRDVDQRYRTFYGKRLNKDIPAPADKTDKAHQNA